ncbi:MAG: toxin-antitoxin system, antitoxin component [Leptospira sp.]|nr:toxin-antitoxin system, antitoxin component [Leptospira sp.]NCS92351.1 toxin-antitoxin system, antitoxin component [Leptospira sp.]
MPQLSLYIDQKTLKKIEDAAKKEKVSISQWAKSKLINSFENTWPDQYFHLYGSIQDESFEKPNQLDFQEDQVRDKL